METRKTAVYLQKMENRSMTSLRSLLSDITDPVFVVDADSEKIVLANDKAITACGAFNPTGERLRDVVHFETDDLSAGPAYFDSKWLNPEQDHVYLNKKLYKKLVLKQNSSLPDEHTLYTIRKMIEVLLHRLRSPMTGMQGYLDMVQDVTSENDKRKLAKVGEGLDYMFKIMDELELLHHAEAYIDDETSATSSEAEKVIKEMIFSYPVDLRNRIEIINSTEDNFQFNPTELTQILTLLLNNAAEHPSAADHPIKIEIHSPRQISITNFGDPIPDEVLKNLFFPFVTTKANNLGIGLSLAQLMASRRRAVIMITENSKETGITFSMLCSPIEKK